MLYICVRWLHSSQADPVLLYSELDEERWETRKVEVFPDLSIGYADASTHSAQTRLGLMPVPLLAEINADPQFVGIEIDAAAFEQAWSYRKNPLWPEPITS